MKNYYWKLIDSKTAKKFLKEKKKIYQIFEDESYCRIENDSDLNDCKESKTEIGIKIQI